MKNTPQCTESEIARQVNDMMTMTMAARGKALAEYCPEKSAQIQAALVGRWIAMLQQSCDAADRAVFLDYLQKTDPDLYGKVLGRMVTLETNTTKHLSKTITEAISC